ERWLGAGRKILRRAACVAVDLGAPVDEPPDQVGLEPDDGVAAAHGPALDRLEQEAHGFPGNLEERRDRRLQVRDQRRPYHLRLAARVAPGARAGRWVDMHASTAGRPPP